MLNLRVIVTAFLLIFLNSTVQAFNGLANGDDTVRDASDVSSAVSLVTSKLEALGYKIEIVVKHAAAAASVGLDLRPTQVIFARPRRLLENMLLRRSPTVGIDLPLKFLVYEDDGQRIRLAFNSMGYLIDRHQLSTLDPFQRLLTDGLRELGSVEDGIISVPSLQGFDDTLRALQDELMVRGFNIPLILDFNDPRKSRPSALHRAKRLPALIVLGNPMVGTPLMQTSQTTANDLPQKFLIWEDRSGETHISYNDPAFLAARHDIEGQDTGIEMISNALATIAAIGAGQ